MMHNILVGLALFLGLAFTFWGMWCNEKTASDKIRMLKAVEAVSQLNYQYLLLKDVGRVSYFRHFYIILTFRDAWALYSPGVRKFKG